MSDDSPLADRSVVVLGASGFIGARLVDKLAREHGARVVAAVRSRASAPSWESDRVDLAEVDFKDAGAIARAIPPDSVVFNLVYDFKGSPKANAALFADILDACEARAVARLVHASTIAVYDGWPNEDLTEDSPIEARGEEYKNAKMDQEAAALARVRDGRLEAVLIQPTIVYGPGSRWFTDLVVERLRGGGIRVPANGEGVCNAVHVDDVADAMILASHRPGVSGERFIVSAAEPVTWRAYFSMYEDLLGLRAVEYPADMAPPAPDPAGGLKGRIKSVARGLLGRRLIGAAKGVLKSALGRAGPGGGGPVVYEPSAGEYGLWAARGRCRIDKARARLGYDPKVTLESARDEFARYVRTLPD